LQNTPGLSGTVDYLGWSLPCVGWNRPVSGPVVVSPGDQRWPRLGRNHLIRSDLQSRPLPAHSSADLL